MKTGGPVFASLALWVVMDADSDFNPETSSLATLYTNLESAVETEVLNKTDDVNSAAVFLKDSLDNDISEVSQILSKVKSEVRSDVETAFESAKCCPPGSSPARQSKTDFALAKSDKCVRRVKQDCSQAYFRA